EVSASRVDVPSSVRYHYIDRRDRLYGSFAGMRITTVSPAPTSSTSDRQFGTLLRRYREVAGLSQEALAERAGMSARAISYLENGSRRPYPDTLHRLAEALSLTPAQRET